MADFDRTILRHCDRRAIVPLRQQTALLTPPVVPPTHAATAAFRAFVPFRPPDRARTRERAHSSAVEQLTFNQ